MVRSPAAIHRDRGVDAGRSLPACAAAAGLFPRSLASRQLLSRGTTDLQVVRAFLAGSMTFRIVNAVTIVAGGAILVSWQWMLALVALAPVAPLLFLCARFEARYGSASRQAQDQAGDLTTAVEESVLGIRVIKGFGQQRSRAPLFTEQAWRLRGTELRKARLLAALSVFITTLPQLAAGATLILGAAEVARPSPVSRNPAGLHRPAAHAASLGGVSRIAAGHDQGDGRRRPTCSSRSWTSQPSPGRAPGRSPRGLVSAPRNSPSRACSSATRTPRLDHRRCSGT